MWIGAGVIRFLASSNVNPAFITSGNLRNSESLTIIQLLASALSLYVISAAMLGLSLRVLRACNADIGYIIELSISLWELKNSFNIDLSLRSVCWVF